MKHDRLRVGTRGSRLSLRQTQVVIDALREQIPGVHIEPVIIQTAGDRAPAVPLEALEGIGFFARELEAALLDGRCDLAVHSAKDLPTGVHGDLCLAAFPPRGDPRDALIDPAGRSLATLPVGARVATSSLRRSAQIRHRRPDLGTVSIRGNIDTRLAKLDRGDCDALCLAGVGLTRMGWGARIAEWLDPEVMLPAPGQGALAVEARRRDEELIDLLREINHPATQRAVEAERAFVARLGSGCRAPAAALAAAEDGTITLEGLVALVDGSVVHRCRASAPIAEAERLGISVADNLLAHAERVIDAFRDAPLPAFPGAGLEGGAP
jgi:hydroxymethylbilane synthase